MDFIKFTDFHSLVPNISEEDRSQINDLFLNLSNPRRYRREENGQPDLNALSVRIAATHSARPTKNNAIYLPSKMRTSVDSWIRPFSKPILLHHDKTDDSIGRVSRSSYVDIVSEIRDMLNLNNIVSKDRPSDAMLDAFLRDELEIQDAVDVVNALVVQDKSVMGNPDYEGMGYIELVANITSPDAIQKILDQRYLTGSVGMISNAAMCSICKKDLIKDGYCKHDPGKIYDGKKCLIVTGDLWGQEYSFVNQPADDLSGIIEINTSQIKDSFECKANNDNKSCRTPEIWFSINKVQMEDNVMTLEDIVALLLSKDEEKKLTEDSAKELANKIFTDESVKQEDLTEDLVLQKAQELSLQDKNEEEDPVKEFWGDLYDEVVGDDPNGVEYATVMYELVQDNLFSKEEIMDAKLSASKRKSLPSSSFCGPNRSFPVPDCAHYTAAKRLIGRYEGPGSKSSILACVNRKGKRLGCKGAGSSSDSIDVGQFTLDYFDTFEDTDLTCLLNGLKMAMSERNLVQEEETHQDSSSDTVNVLTSNLDAANEQLLDLTNTYKEVLVSDVLNAKVLKGELTTEEQKTECFSSLKESEIEDLENIRKSLGESIDWLQIGDKLNSGMARIPTGTVELLIESGTTEVIEDATLATVRKEFNNIKARYGKTKAMLYIDSLKRSKRIPADFSISE